MEQIARAVGLIAKIDELVRVVLSGRRRNMQVEIERIDIRPVKIKEEIKLQLTYSDGRAVTTKNIDPDLAEITKLLSSGYANILVEHINGSLSLRFTKKDEVLVHEEKSENKQDLSHDRTKERLLDSADPFLIEIGISDHKGVVKPSRQDKYRQVEEFLRILNPTLTSAISAGQIHKPTTDKPLTIVDFGCGHAYLTFAAHQFLMKQGIPVRVIGIDIRTESRDRNNEIAKKLGISKTIEFRAQEIKEAKTEDIDVAIALHACDTATDDSIASSVLNGAKLLLVAPCCHHNLQAQIKDAPAPWGMLTKHGLMKERLVDLITDGLRTQILKLVGYRVEAIEFVAGEHTPRNLMIRAVKTGAKPDQIDIDLYKQMLDQWKVTPVLAAALADQLH